MGTTDEPAELAKRFESVLRTEVPTGRDGKHKKIITRLLEEISHLDEKSALKVALSELPDSKENIRAALNRAARQRNVSLGTSSDSEFLYIWKAVPVDGRGGA